MSRTLEAILDDLDDAADDETVTVGGILDTFENRPLGVLLALFGMLGSIPVIGGLPGAPLVLCVFILTAIGQSVFASGGLWAPRKLRAVEIGGERIARATEKARPWVRKIDAVVKERLEYLVANRSAKIAVTVCSAILALAFLPLSFIPWGVQAPAMAIAAFGLALMGNDGLFALFGYALVAATLYVATMLIP